MITKLYQSIAAGLMDIKQCPVYIEDVPQDFKQPSFFITIYQQDNVRGINGRLKNEVNIDVMYFPADGPEKIEECLTVGQEMNREFYVKDFKINNRSMKIEDGTLHYMFDVAYREFKEQEAAQMAELSQNERIKEE